ncbi:hypothetical protein HHK36_010935 [Tetracentron sinense]|uniref:Uncharacterized protein n=1 Tax=Tetracentron sinense TaxID=13715 RepID=A0A835DK08_TETSI|nr:hypothetical protein HHK36_010935 [Tetracentron sinense]
MKMVHDEIRKGPWTEQEDLQLACFVSLFGERRWDFIAKVSGLKVAGDTASSQSGNNHVVDSLPNTQIKEGSLHDKECPGIDLSVRGGESEEEEEAAKGYSMDQIWKEIASLEDESSREVYDKYREDGGNFSYSPMGPSLWDYCADSLWRMEGEEIKMLLPMADHFVSCYEHTTAS